MPARAMRQRMAVKAHIVKGLVVQARTLSQLQKI
jgi:hypothetical protein